MLHPYMGIFKRPRSSTREERRGLPVPLGAHDIFSHSTIFPGHTQDSFFRQHHSKNTSVQAVQGKIFIPYGCFFLSGFHKSTDVTLLTDSGWKAMLWPVTTIHQSLQRRFFSTWERTHWMKSPQHHGILRCMAYYANKWMRAWYSTIKASLPLPLVPHTMLQVLFLMKPQVAQNDFQRQSHTLGSIIAVVCPVESATLRGGVVKAR